MAANRLISTVLVLGTVYLGPPLSSAARAAGEPDCFDAQIYASIARQTPTVIPDCGADCIIMRWPWILELNVERVIEGKVDSNPLTVLTVQHAYYADLGAGRWWLRRNSLGAFNVLKVSNSTPLPLCSEGAPPARPYIQPSNGKTLRDLEREGEEYYGKQP